jgi:hypothetical protein
VTILTTQELKILLRLEAARDIVRHGNGDAPKKASSFANLRHCGLLALTEIAPLCVHGPENSASIMCGF